MSACRDPCVYLFIALFALHKIDARTHRLLEAKKKKKQYVLRETVASIVHSLFVSVGMGLTERDLRNPRTESQRQQSIWGGTLFHIMIRYHQ